MFRSPSALAASLTEAVESRQLVAYYQPQVDIASGRVVSVEALARWIHPQFGVISPMEFIPVAEATGTISQVDRAVFTQAVRQVSSWASQSLNVELSVNVSPSELIPGLVDELTPILQTYGVDPHIVTMEVTESEPIHDLPRAVEALHELRAIGIGVSIDDFGTGYSSVSQLRDLPTTELKIDQSLIRGPRDVAGRALGTALTEAVDLGLRIVAEGVETHDQMDHAIELGCHRAQGYIIGAPMGAEEFESRFR